MPIQLTGSLDISGSILLNGTAVTASGGGGSTSLSDNFSKYVNMSRADYTYIADTDAGLVDVHISQSNATYFISSSDTLTSFSNVNLYFYPEALAPNEVNFVYFELPPRGSTGNVYIIRSLVEVTGSSSYWIPTTAVGVTNTNITSLSTNTIFRRSSVLSTNPTIMYKDENNEVWFATIANFPLNTTNYYNFTGSQGTPLT